MTTARPDIQTMANLEAAFAGESMAHIKYRYFAKLARAAGDEETARTFEETADQEVMHAFGHLDLLYPKASMTPTSGFGATRYTELGAGGRLLTLPASGTVKRLTRLGVQPRCKTIVNWQRLHHHGRQSIALAKVLQREQAILAHAVLTRWREQKINKTSRLRWVWGTSRNQSHPRHP